MSKNRTPLLSDFEKQSTEQWEQQVLKELKGKSLEEVSTTSEDGIVTKPFYHHNDFKNTGNQLWKNEVGNPWLVVEKITVSDVKKANKQALHALMQGANALWFTGAISPENVKELLQGIELPYIHTFVESQENTTLLQEGYHNLITASFAGTDCPGGVYSKPFSVAATLGAWKNGKQQTLDYINASSNPKFMISGVQWRNAGCSIAQELAIFLAEANEYLGLLNAKQQTSFANQLVFQTGIGENYFFEMAKIRAIRLLWNNLLTGYQIKNVSLHIHAESILFNKSVYDAPNNLLRTSTEAMSAIMGGCDSLHVVSFDESYQGESTLGNRMARNIQSILKEESYLDKIADPANGSYYIENLTAEIAQKAWPLFQAIEAQGGYIAALESNQLQEMTAASFTEQELAFENGEKIILGVNRYPDAKEQTEASTIQAPAPVKNGKTFMAIQTTRVAAKQEAARQQQNIQ